MLRAKTDQPFVVRLRNTHDEQSGYVDVLYGNENVCDKYVQRLQSTLPNFIEIWLLDTATLGCTWYTTGVNDVS